MNKLYLYTTDSDRTKKRYKFGGVFSDRTTESRVKNQQTGNSEELEIILSVECELTDHYVHDELEKLGYTRVGKGGREWFQGFETDDEASAVLLKIVSDSNVPTKLSDYVPRFYQDYVKMMFLFKLKSLTNPKNQFALELAPRFGKTLWVLDLLQTLSTDYGYKVVFLPAYVLTALSSFEKEFYSFNGFKDHMVITTVNDNLQEIIENNRNGKLVVVPISLHMEDYETKLKYLTTIPQKYKLSVIDEADFGCHRENSQNFINYLDSALDIYMTGTAIDKVVSPLDNVGDNIIRWSYSDMLMVQNGEHPIQKFLV